MATLIGRECWHAGAVLSHGKVMKHSLEANAVVIQTGKAFDSPITVHSSQVLLTLDAAIDAVDDAIDYWTRKADDLRNQRDGIS